MAKIDKSQYTKAEWKVLKEQRRQEKRLKLLENTLDVDNVSAQDTAFVIGNGKSRLPVNLEQIKTKGKVYACNAVYRTFQPDHLIAVDVKMVLEINKAGFQHNNTVWTNPNKSYERIQRIHAVVP